MKTTTATHTESAQLIDEAAREGRLYHFNGGQAYIGIDSETLLIIDMTQEVPDFKHYADAFGKNYMSLNSPVEFSEKIAKNPLTPFYQNLSVSRSGN